jgi:hypothetical protein
MRVVNDHAEAGSDYNTHCNTTMWHSRPKSSANNNYEAGAKACTGYCEAGSLAAAAKNDEPRDLGAQRTRTPLKCDELGHPPAKALDPQLDSASDITTLDPSVVLSSGYISEWRFFNGRPSAPMALQVW